MKPEIDTCGNANSLVPVGNNSGGQGPGGTMMTSQHRYPHTFQSSPLPE